MTDERSARGGGTDRIVSGIVGGIVGTGETGRERGARRARNGGDARTRRVLPERPRASNERRRESPDDGRRRRRLSKREVARERRRGVQGETPPRDRARDVPLHRSLELDSDHPRRGRRVVE
tara:strand:- start:427 stop:792 length:366 start_codon:yes stop_codon:yes gene_type:complete